MKRKAVDEPAAAAGGDSIDPITAGLAIDTASPADLKRKKKAKDVGVSGNGTHAAAGKPRADPVDEHEGGQSSKPGKAHGPQQQPQQQQQQPAPAGKGAPVLAWMRVPVTLEGGVGVDVGSVRGLDPRLAQALTKGGFPTLFPVQAAVWRETAGGMGSLHDVCVCAPTGSGKTLAYALPVVQGLAASGPLPGLRALVILPTRDLAAQVFSVFQTLCPAVGLRAGLAAGRVSEAAEAAVLLTRLPVPPASRAAMTTTTGNGGGVGRRDGTQGQAAAAVAAQPAAGMTSAVDVLVATPGRLLTHLAVTSGAGSSVGGGGGGGGGGGRGLHLGRLRFLVVDETDRLMRQAYNQWLPTVMSALQAAPDYGPSTSPRVVKLVVSATLTADPSKISRLQLHSPRYIAMSSQDYRYKLPRQLQELKVLCQGGGADKALHLLALLRGLKGCPTVVFTASVEATHRLWLLLSACNWLPERAVEYNSQLPSHTRQANLRAFKTGDAKVLVASDAMTRGMDVEGVGAVINYDAPVYAKTYVHRAGRTARAGRAGRVFTLLRPEDMRHFKAMLRKADNTYVIDKKVAAEELQELRPGFEEALQRMQDQQWQCRHIIAFVWCQQHPSAL